MRGISSIFVLTFLVVSGCGSPESSPEPPNYPQLLPGASAACESVRQQASDENGNPYKILRLARISFQAQDLDGATTLESPRVRLNGTILKMGEPTSTAEQPLDCPADVGACRVEYTWALSESKDAEQETPGMGIGDILCGPGGSDTLFDPPLFLEVEIYDSDGWSSNGNLEMTIATEG
ncbi:MAG: hypothetical protein VX589_14910 [Myxococcota bacterium]|nr:hypothetical protein [Myxococcota bacterium]